jgi:hypothetical protein
VSGWFNCTEHINESCSASANQSVPNTFEMSEQLLCNLRIGGLSCSTSGDLHSKFAGLSVARNVYGSRRPAFANSRVFGADVYDDERAKVAARLAAGEREVPFGSERGSCFHVGAVLGPTPTTRSRRWRYGQALAYERLQKGRGRCDRAPPISNRLLVLGGAGCSAWGRAGMRLVPGSGCGPDE